MTYDERKRALRFLRFIKENVMGQLSHKDVLMEGQNVNTQQKTK